ncbi:MAG: FKBP-type peptidyl-prolyl cis-trans isomerase [Prevotellaceae bacterium]|jgi:FKBP-type peptidyl-prolyl cis-trans isomerase|nr:FKBP-type peptidyl-prolyl cis-trans isomerase [Prevotellaceae bacterium]
MKKVCVAVNILLVLLSFACANTADDKKSQQYIEVNPRENIEKVNKFLSEKDKDRIESFLRRQDLTADFDESGFWIARIEPGNGTKIQEGSAVALAATISLLDGTLCYTYTEYNPLIFVVNKSNELSETSELQNAVSGLHSALSLLEDQERAVLIFPPHLAHGVIGDNNNIPPRSILVYDIKVLEVK